MCMATPPAVLAVDYDPNDFAVEVVEYIAGTGIPVDSISGEPFNNPGSALGRPTLMTSGDGSYIRLGEPVVVLPVAPAYRSFELVTVGNGGHLTLKFSHPVRDDRNNPYGVDFIVFGNSMQGVEAGSAWRNGNPEDVRVTNTCYTEPGIVSVSQDGTNWCTFATGPYADSFAPTAGYRWDSANNVWAQELDPTKPIDPQLTVAGMTVAEMIDAYDGSAGGTGFDLADVGLDWIMYVRIDDDPTSGATTEIDAVADVSACGDYRHPFPAGDVNTDCRVDMGDVAIIAEHWLECTWNCQ